ncbi:hypothetical protein E34_1054 [Lactococcus lactis subsp. lactis]|uniref:hypothetical protein n=1 Tax=Lactococcus lactis TaxID=1358 RepID=UPI00071CD87D|nr:hypothetical protein [Lactococcus lactis]KST79103.1 hypothetical protein E34_1054 [Lactococcus lactis subsp. lactis]
MNINAILCEGAAEEAIIEILLNNSLIKIEADEYLLDDGPIKVRSAEEFCERYLGTDFEGKVDVYRILDSRSEKFNFKTRRSANIYEEKLNVHNIITAPEIEILIIICEDKYEKFLKAGLKPSDFCKIYLKFRQVKTYDFIMNYFSDFNTLLHAIKLYHQKKKKKQNTENTLYDLLKPQYK